MKEAEKQFMYLLIIIVLFGVCFFIGQWHGKTIAKEDLKESVYKSQRDSAIARYELSRIRETILIDQDKRKQLKISALEKGTKALSIKIIQTIHDHEAKIANLSTAPDSVIDAFFRARYKGYLETH